ncbi:hypothetical protein PMSD_10350 [Paenibacillus macquariensis subsp. defensor]|nr:hypothetical protein PMSD_10350 [Paenibacillus macquariensis subsp. defensor]
MRDIVILLLVVFSLVGSGHSTPIKLPLGEQEVKRLMSEQMAIQGWQFSIEGDQYSFSSIPSDPNANGITYKVNSNTGTVYDSTSGGPQTNLVVKDAPNLKDITNGEVYYDEIYKIANPILKNNGLVPATKEWILGGYDEGYLYGYVKKGNQQITIKFDIFTEKWEEIKDPFGD